MAQQSTYDEALAASICERLVMGESLRGICTDENMPSEMTVRRWALDDVGGFASQYARAREMQADNLAEEILTISDTEDDPAKARNRMEARKWFASKVAPKRYGDKITQEHTGKDGAALPSVAIFQLPDNGREK